MFGPDGNSIDPPSPWRTVVLTIVYSLVSWGFAEYTSFLSSMVPVPITTSAMYFTATSVVLLIYGCWVPPQKPDLAHFVLLLPAALCTCLVVIAASTADRYDGIHEPITEMVSSAAPILTLCWALLLRMERPAALLLWGVMLAGGGLMCFLYRESKINAAAIFLAFFSSALSSMRFVLCQRTLQSPNGLFRPPTANADRRSPPSPPLPPMSALYYYVPMCTLIMVPSAFVAELVDSVAFIKNPGNGFVTAAALLFGGLVAFVFLVLQFNVIYYTSAITTGLATEMRSPLCTEFAVMVSVATSFRVEKWVGFCVSILGLVLYLRYRWTMRRIVHDLSRDVYGGYNVVSRAEDGVEAGDTGRWDSDGYQRRSQRVLSDDEDAGGPKAVMKDSPILAPTNGGAAGAARRDKEREAEAMERMASALAVSGAHSTNAGGEDASDQEEEEPW